MTSPSPYSAQELFRLFAETDRKIRESSAETDRKFQETDRKFQETDRKFQETDRKLKALTDGLAESRRQSDQQWGRFSNRLGEFVEEMVRPAAVRLFRERGIDVCEVHRQVVAQRGAIAMEIDLLVIDRTELVAIEVKSQASVEDVNAHLARLQQFHAAFPAYHDYRVMGAVAAMVLPDEVARYAYRQGLFVLGQTGDTITILNDDAFVAKVW